MFASFRYKLMGASSAEYFLSFDYIFDISVVFLGFGIYFDLFDIS